jgi:hypothetical protein
VFWWFLVVLGSEKQSQSYGKAKVKRQKVKLEKTGVHRKGWLKKQTQFAGNGNKRKVNSNIKINEINWIGYLVKTNPIKANLLVFSVLRKSTRRLTAESQGLRSP